MSKKVQIVIASIIGQLFAVALVAFLPDLPFELITKVIMGIAGTGIAGALGQGVADGWSKGVTSTNFKNDPTTFKELAEAGTAGNSLAPETP